MAEEEHQSCVHDVKFDPAGVSGIRKVGSRAEIDTSPQFGSVQEAVTWFGGRGYWVPSKLQDNYVTHFLFLCFLLIAHL